MEAMSHFINENLKGKFGNKDKLYCSYHPGPIKRTQRCIGKSETDYADKNFPTVAQIGDIVRGTLNFDDCLSMLAALKLFIKIVKSQNTCLKVF